MKNTLRKGFTLIELIVVITILAILGTGGFIFLNGNIDNADFSNDEKLYNQISQRFNNLFVTDFAVDGISVTDHSIRYDRNQNQFAIGTLDNSDASDLTYAEAGVVFKNNYIKDLGLTDSQFNVVLCDSDATDANIDTALNAATSGPFYELILFTDETATGTNCSGTITAGSTELAGYTFRYKNARLDDKSDNYDSSLKSDGGTRIGTTALNTAGENTKGVFTSLNSSLPVTNKGF